VNCNPKLLKTVIKLLAKVPSCHLIFNKWSSRENNT